MTEAATTKKTTKKRRGRPRKTKPAAPEPAPQENAAAAAADEDEINRRVEERFAKEKAEREIQALIDVYCAPTLAYTPDTWLHAPTCPKDQHSARVCAEHGCKSFSGEAVAERIRAGWWNHLPRTIFKPEDPAEE